MSKKMGIVDLGSNSARMMIMKVEDNGAYHRIEQAKEMIRLSEGMGEEKILTPYAIARAIHVLKNFKDLMQFHQVKEIFAVATAAVRNAKNQQVFLEKVRQETGFSFKVLSGEQEAYYGYLGVINTMDIDEGVIVDIGGASTELIWVKNREFCKAVSLPFGAVTLTEGFLGKEVIEKKKQKALEHYIRNQLTQIPWMKEVQGYPMIGLGGTMRSLAKIHKRQGHDFQEKLQHYEMNNRTVMGIYDLVMKINAQERKSIPGLKKKRADIIVGGLLPIKVLMDWIKPKKLIVSRSGLWEGIFYEQYLENIGYIKPVLKDVLSHSIENILKNYRVNRRHSVHVRKLALSLFDQTQTIHRLGEQERRLLEVGALLHDVGEELAGERPLDLSINGMTSKEQGMCLLLLQMYHQEEQKRNWKHYRKSMDKINYQRIKKLALFLGLAENLDRDESGRVKDVICSITPKSLRLGVKSSHASTLALAIKYYERAFEKLFDRKLHIR